MVGLCRLQAYRNVDTAVVMPIAGGRRAGARHGGQAAVVTMARRWRRFAMVLVFVPVLGCRFAVVPVVGCRATFRPVVPMVWCRLCYRRQQGQHGYYYEFLHNFDISLYVYFIELLRFDNLMYLGERTGM